LVLATHCCWNRGCAEAQEIAGYLAMDGAKAIQCVGANLPGDSGIETLQRVWQAQSVIQDQPGCARRHAAAFTHAESEEHCERRQLANAVAYVR
jgi:hypothetical protein